MHSIAVVITDRYHVLFFLLFFFFRPDPCTDDAEGSPVVAGRPPATTCEELVVAVLGVEDGTRRGFFHFMSGAIQARPQAQDIVKVIMSTPESVKLKSPSSSFGIR